MASLTPRRAILTAALSLGAALGAACPSRTHTPGEPRDGAPEMTDSATFSCDDAPRLLGAADAKLVRCTTVLPGLHTVVLERPPGGPPNTTMHNFLWLDGAVAEGAGLASLERYLAELRAHERDDLTPEAVEVLLLATAGAPPGFSAHAIHGNLRGAAGGVTAGGVTARPFSVTLIQNHWTAPADPALVPPGQPPGPPPGMQPPGGPPPGMQPPGGPPPGMQPPGGPPPGMQPPGGAAPPLVAKAVLTLDADYRGEWAISVMMPFGQAFEPKLSVPLRPAR